MTTQKNTGISLAVMVLRVVKNYKLKKKKILLTKAAYTYSEYCSMRILTTVRGRPLVGSWA